MFVVSVTRYQSRQGWYQDPHATEAFIIVLLLAILSLSHLPPPPPPPAQLYGLNARG